MNPKNFFVEMRRRNLYKVAVAYGIVAWLLIQVATQVFPFFEIPNWCVRLVIVLLALGFPIAVILAWAYELTPEGIKRTEDVVPAESIKRHTGRRLNALIIGVLLCAVAFLLYQRFRPNESSTAPEKSIAVLPFDNFSADPENAFFADGIQDDVLTSLSKIRELKVTSRTSVMTYRARTGRNIRNIGKALGVAHILEGSVRRSGDRVKVSVQLIDARDDRHLWAESYDKTISDALTLQGELATEIAGALRATLSPEEKANVSRKPTGNADAYVLYLRARQLEIKADTLFEDFKSAVQLYREVIKLDPGFALAHARFSATAARIYHFHEPTVTWKEQAKVEAETALRLQPSLGEGHYARGLCFYWLESDYERAKEALAQASRFLPNDTEIGLIMAAIARRQGRWQESLSTFQKIEAIDPKNPNISRNLVYSNSALCNWDEAAKAAQRWIALAPNSTIAREQAAYVDFLWKGSTEALERFVDTTPLPITAATRWDVRMIQRDFAGAEAALAASPLNAFEYLSGIETPKAYLTGCTALARGDSAGAQAAFEAARPIFEDAVREAPQSAVRHANLGLLYAFMGRKEAAIQEGRRAVELKPVAVDAVDGTMLNSYLALIYARAGEREQALSLIARLLETPHASDTAHYSVSLQDLRHRWEWDSLRTDPRFLKLIGEPLTSASPALGH